MKTILLALRIVFTSINLNGLYLGSGDLMALEPWEQHSVTCSWHR